MIFFNISFHLKEKKGGLVGWLRICSFPLLYLSISFFISRLYRSVSYQKTVDFHKIFKLGLIETKSPTNSLLLEICCTASTSLRDYVTASSSLLVRAALATSLYDASLAQVTLINTCFCCCCCCCCCSCCCCCCCC